MKILRGAGIDPKLLFGRRMGASDCRMCNGVWLAPNCGMKVVTGPTYYGNPRSTTATRGFNGCVILLQAGRTARIHERYLASGTLPMSGSAAGHFTEPQMPRGKRWSVAGTESAVLETSTSRSKLVTEV